MEEKSKFIGIAGFIALRKSELFLEIIDELSKDNELSDKDKEKIKNYIAEMDNERFLSKYEKMFRKINPRLKLDDIDDLYIDSIIDEINI